MKVNRKLRRFITGALSLLLCAGLLIPSAWAVRAPSSIEGFDSSKKCSLTVNYKDAGGADSRPRVSLYKVASVDENVTFLPAGEFAGDQNLKNDLADARRTGEWTVLVQSLQAAAESGNYAKVSGSPKQVDSAGKVQFTGLEPGLYLVTAENYQVTTGSGGTTKTVFYTPSSYLICLPNWVESTSGGAWAYDIISNAKVNVSEREKIQIHVFKVWNDQNDKKDIRPKSVTVALMRGGRIVDTQELSAANSWRYTWTDLDNSGSGQWSVTELNVPDGYRFKVTKTGTNLGWSFTVENYIPTDKPPRDPKDPPHEPEEPDIPLEDPEVPKSDLPEDPPEDDEILIDDPDVPLSDLPQTGQLWWPVPFMAVAGMFLIVVGYGRRRRSEYEED